MPSVGYIIADYVCPTIGAILSTLTFAAPIKSLKSSMRNGSLGSLNPTPWAFMTGNTIGWLAYSYITLDLFVFFANAPGLMISIWLNVGAMKLQYYEEIIKYSSIQSTDGGGDVDATEEDEEDKGNENDAGAETANGGEANKCYNAPSLTSHEWRVLTMVIIWMVILSVTSLIPISKDEMKFVVGVAVNINLIFFYAAPLSTIVTVLRTKSSSTIHFATMVMNTCNAFFWCVYSFAIQDYYILIPNGLGFMFGLVQVMLYLCYPRSLDGGGGGMDGGDGTEQFLDEDGNSKDNSRESETEII
mmetsp:Transcript_28085/g.59295  ORF Transcript_28085/g.59295 Transcript_28085/m.59295 type:complete len:302 (+) Transcript_28085:285-1190(+)